MEDVLTENTYTIRPNFKQKFRPAAVKDIIHKELMDYLTDKTYNSDEAPAWSKQISDNLVTQLKTLGLDRYKFVVQVVIGEQRGEGVKMGSRCFWDSDTDNYAQDIYLTETMFCVAVAYGIYFY